jgi:hypothetical protein
MAQRTAKAVSGRPGRFDVQVIGGEDGEPREFFWRGRWRRVLRVQEAWVDAGAWWAGEAPCWFFRVATEEGMYELASEHPEDFPSRPRPLPARPSPSWLYRVYD